MNIVCEHLLFYKGSSWVSEVAGHFKIKRDVLFIVTAAMLDDWQDHWAQF